MSSAFDNLELPENADVKIHQNIMCVTKWNWDYADALEFQERSQKFIREHKKNKIYIFCNHPHVFTLGRGNERGVDGLQDFNEQESSNLSFPLYRIKRGGGITFHYPGQWIFYPIVAINPQLNLENLMCWMLKEVSSNLKETFGVKDVLAAKKLMGVWVGRKKIASIGLGVNRLVTEHGLALNLQRDSLMQAELIKVSPCGLAPDTYLSLEDLNNNQNNIIEFHNSFLQRLFI